jgi:hypothetical protein
MTNTILCKLTDQQMQTFDGFQWELGVPPPMLNGAKELCSSSWYPCYEHPLLAVLLNPMHADIDNPRLFLIDVEGGPKLDYGLKRGYRRMTLTEELPVPEITQSQRIAFGILCALEVTADAVFETWAKDWLAGESQARSRSKAVALEIETRVKTSEHRADKAAWMAATAASFSSPYATETWVASAVVSSAKVKPLDLIALAEKALTYS